MASGVGGRVTWPEHGSFVRPRKMGNVHIAVAELVPGIWRAACGKLLQEAILLPADDDEPRQCNACWDAM